MLCGLPLLRWKVFLHFFMCYEMEGLFALASAKTVRTLAKTVRTIDGGINALYFLKRIHLLGFYMVRKSCESRRLYTIDWIGS